MTDRQTRAGDQHPEEWRRDLNPDPGAGLNRGGAPLGADDQTRSAHEHKNLHRSIEGFSDDELRRIPIVPAGERLRQGAVYIDLRSHDRQEIRARGDMEAGPDNLYVPKDEVDYQLWNKLTGVDNPERTGDADDS